MITDGHLRVEPDHSVNKAMTLRHRPYTASDRDACVEVFRSNVPKFFRDHELEEFTDFIDAFECPYFVVLSDDEIIGCGGFGIEADSETASLCWGMVQQEHHGKRIGAYLLFFRLHEIATSTDAKFVRLRTSQHTEGFFRRYGFSIESTEPDGFAPGLDDVEMRIELTDANCEVIGRFARSAFVS